MPRATKNRVTKKSRILVTLAITSTVVGKRGHADAGDERAHLSRKVERIGGTAHQKAPGERGDQHKLGDFGDEGEKAWQRVAAQTQRHQYQSPAFDKGRREHAETRIVQVRLQREKDDRPDVLKYQNAQGNPAWQSREFEFVVKQFDDDQRAAERKGYGKV